MTVVVPARRGGVASPSSGGRHAILAAAAFSLLFLYSSVLPVALGASSTSPDDSSHCWHECGPHGTCRPSPSAPTYETNAFSSYECECDESWSGPDCSVPYVTCDDGKRRCYNNSECRRNTKPNEDDGTYGYKCDCSLSFGISSFAGHECENSATQICAIAPTSRHAFCTNGGTCLAYVLPGDEHSGCDCPPEFEGAHCQYLLGTAPAEELERQDPRAYNESHTSRGGHVGAGGIAAIILVILGVFAGMVYLGHKYYLEREGVEKNYSESLAQFEEHMEGEGLEDGGEYDLNGRRREEVELATTGGSAAAASSRAATSSRRAKSRKEEAITALAAAMELDPDGSSTMGPGQREVELATGRSRAAREGTVWKENTAVVAAASAAASHSMVLDPDGSSTMPPREGTAVVEGRRSSSAGATAKAKTGKAWKEKTAIAAAGSMVLDPDGSSSMPPRKGRGTTANAALSEAGEGDTFDEEGRRTGGGGDLI